MGVVHRSKWMSRSRMLYSRTLAFPSFSEAFFSNVIHNFGTSMQGGNQGFHRIFTPGTSFLPTDSSQRSPSINFIDDCISIYEFGDGVSFLMLSRVCVCVTVSRLWCLSKVSISGIPQVWPPYQVCPPYLTKSKIWEKGYDVRNDAYRLAALYFQSTGTIFGVSDVRFSKPQVWSPPI